MKELTRHIPIKCRADQQWNGIIEYSDIASLDMIETIRVHNILKDSKTMYYRVGSKLSTGQQNPLSAFQTILYNELSWLPPSREIEIPDSGGWFMTNPLLRAITDTKVLSLMCPFSDTKVYTVTLGNTMTVYILGQLTLGLHKAINELGDKMDKIILVHSGGNLAIALKSYMLLIGFSTGATVTQELKPYHEITTAIREHGVVSI